MNLDVQCIKQPDIESTPFDSRLRSNIGVVRPCYLRQLTTAVSDYARVSESQGR